MNGGAELVVSPRSEIGGIGSDTEKYLTVSLGNERFGIPVAKVKEIIECNTITSLPMSPAAVRGAINLRGRVVPVVDLSVRFGRAPMEIGRKTCIVIAEIASVASANPFDVGLLVDAVNEVVDIRPEDIEAAPSMDGALRTDFTLGMGRVRSGFVLLLRIEALVAVKDLEGLVPPGPGGATQ